MSDHVYRIGIVGTGGIARAHGTACQQVDIAEIAAICDVSQEAVNRYGDQFEVTNRYTDLDEMLNVENLDIAIICTWGASHAEIGIQIANSQQVKAILCEKPFTDNAAQAGRWSRLPRQTACYSQRRSNSVITRCTSKRKRLWIRVVLAT